MDSTPAAASGARPAALLHYASTIATYDDTLQAHAAHIDAAYLIDPQAGSRRMLAKGHFQWPAWSPNGSQLALVAIDCQQFAPNRYLVTLDTSALVGVR